MLASLIRRTMAVELNNHVPTVHMLTNDPNRAWTMIADNQVIEKPKLPNIDAPIYPNKVRFVCISDTHNRHQRMGEIPDGDVLLHAGDFTMIGKPDEVESFNTWIGTLPHKYKIVIAGNHELSFDSDIMYGKMDMYEFGLDMAYLQERGLIYMKELLTNCTYLEDSSTTVGNITVYGSPWQPEFCDWGFNLPRGQECLNKWNMIPEGVDVLMTHGPPIGHGDMCTGRNHTGCVELLSTIQNRVKCKYHVYGHVHEGYGATTDGVTTYINASTCTRNYQPRNEPIIFDIPLPAGVTKSDFLSTATVKEKSEEMKQDEDEDMEVGEPFKMS